MKRLSDKTMQKIRILQLVLTVALAALSCVKAPPDSYRDGSLWLQHLGTLVLLLPLLADLKLRKFSLPVCIGLFVFTCLHILGARYLYSDVPYARWAERLFGWRITMAAVHPNKFDRLVHLAFGLLLLPLFVQVSQYWFKVKNFMHALLLGWLFVQCFGMLYEIFEWLLSVFMRQTVADGYNGQQGDLWDAQKDMFLALIGSTITAAFLALLHRFARKPAATEDT